MLLPLDVRPLSAQSCLLLRYCHLFSYDAKNAAQKKQKKKRIISNIFYVVQGAFLHLCQSGQCSENVWCFGSYLIFWKFDECYHFLHLNNISRWTEYTPVDKPIAVLLFMISHGNDKKNYTIDAKTPSHFIFSLYLDILRNLFNFF